MKNKFLKLLLLGIVLYIIGNFFLPLFLKAIPNTIFLYNILKFILESGANLLDLSSKILIVGSLSIYVIKDLWGNIWDQLVEGILSPFTGATKKHLQDVSSEVSTIRKKTEELVETFQGFLIENKKPLSMETCRTLDDFDNLMLPPCRELFGKHIDNDESMFTYVRKVYLDAFSQAPHPSSVFKKISIENHNEYPDYVKWKEETRYKIHHVAYANKPETGRYLLRFKGTSFAPGLTEEEWAKSLQLKLRVDGRNLISPGDQPKFVTDDTGEEGFFCRKKGNWVHLWFKKQIDLHQEWTDVTSEEISINSKLDRVYTLHTNKPTCYYTLDVTLPKELKFIKHPFTTPKIIYSGLPDFIKRDLPKKTTIEHDSDNHIRVAIQEWVMPGIVLNLNWIDDK